MRSRNWLLLLASALLLFVAACTMPVEPTPVPPFEAPETPVVENGALVDEVVVLTVGIPPTEYAVEIHGSLRDGCTEIESVTQTVDGDRIIVTVETVRDPDAICTQALVPFVHVEPLDVEGLDPGEYTVEVDGVTAALEIVDAPDDVEPVAEDALVDEVIVLTEGVPVTEYAVEIHGHLRDGCTEIDSVTQSIEDGRIVITINTVRDPDALCTMALVPFVHVEPLDVEGLDPGEYTVEVNGVTATLELAMNDFIDNGIVDRGMVGQDALIDAVRVIAEATPPAAFAIEIQGHFRDGCTSLHSVTQAFDGERIIVTVNTLRDPEAMCTMALVPFTYTIPLNIAGLEAGEYTVEVDGVTATLTLSEEDEVTIPRGYFGIAEDEMVVGRAMVEQVEVLILESYPVQINVVIEGYLGDGCTELSGIAQSVEGNRIYLTVYTERPVDAICTLALVGFEETVSLDLTELEPGEYTIVVHNVTEELVLDEGMLGSD